MGIRRAFSMIEILIVVIIVGILSSLAIYNFGPAKEKTADKEASSCLKLLQAAEKTYYLENGSAYYPSSGSITDISLINQNLHVSLRTDTTRLWDYTVKSNGCTQATRNGGDSRNWYLAITDTEGEPDSGNCP